MNINMEDNGEAGSDQDPPEYKEIPVVEEPTAAAPSSTGPNREVIDGVVQAWFHSLHGSALSRSTEAHNFISASIPALVDALVREL